MLEVMDLIGKLCDSFFQIDIHASQFQVYDSLFLCIFHILSALMILVFLFAAFHKAHSFEAAQCR
ncbi:hypothetical protein HanRHA438_Chr13g0619641 [Helianthus annuus]|nr:hypothetical protein HanRHA438_Chr13g0619641 [Helianthus annuus]